MPMSEEVRRRLLGTSANRDLAPWQTYDRDMDPMAGESDYMKQAVAEYAQRRHVITSQHNVEELIRQQEFSTNMVKDYRFYRQEEDDLADNGQTRKGRVMHCLEFLEKLQTILPAYLSATVRKGLCGLAVYKPYETIVNGQTERIDWQYVCGVQVGYCYEYSVLHFDSHGLPLNEKWRGWRTVLLRLIQKNYITEQQAEEVFGKATGPASRRYLEQLYYFRNRKEKDE